MATYDELRQRHLSRFFEIMPSEFAAVNLPLDELRELQQSRLRLIVAHAQSNSPWHRTRLAKIDPAGLTLDQLRDLPTMTKDDLMENFDEIVTDRRLTRDAVEQHLATLQADTYLFDEYHVCASGGSSGRRGAFLYDFDAWAIPFACFLRFNLRFGEQALAERGGPAAIMAIVAADKASHMTAALSQTFDLPGGRRHRLSAIQPIPELISQLEGIQPDFLWGYATVIYQLAREALAGRLGIKPAIVGTTSEPLLPEMRAIIKEAWDVPVFNGFGSTEGLMGGSCIAERGIHLSEDHFIIEPVDRQGRPVASGQRAAKVYLTSLFNRTQPLIRYELTDEMTVLDGPCPCGSSLLRIDDLEGRIDDAFSYEGGVEVHPFTFRSVLGRERAIAEYQVRQTPHGAQVAIRCEGAVDVEGLVSQLEAALEKAGVADAAVTIAVVDSLTRQESGKFRRFIPCRTVAAEE